MLTALAVLGGFGLDLLLADPAWMPHPVVWMGRAITWLEKVLRRLFPDSPAGQRAAGRGLAAVLPLGTFALAAGGCAGARRGEPAPGFAGAVVWGWQARAPGGPGGRGAGGGGPHCRGPRPPRSVLRRGWCA